MDEDVASLIREERIAAAASLASKRGDARTASELFERACEWQRAAHEALRAESPERALRLAVLARDSALAERALEGLTSDGASAERVAVLLSRQSEHGWAARAFEMAGKNAEAASSWEREGNAVRAAELLESMHDVVGAARVLESATRNRKEDWANYVALGALLLRYGKTERQPAHFRRFPTGRRSDAKLFLLIVGLEQLGLMQAASEARSDLRAIDATGKKDDARPGIATVATSTQTPEVRTRIYGRYEVLREVASTASARVVECLDTVRQEHVAVKVFAGYGARGGGRDILLRFEREVKVLGSLDHPNVVPLLDYFPDGPALVLAWMPGGTLETMMAAGPIAPSRAVEIAGAVLGALGEAHRLGVLHRDMKPSNVLFDSAGAARLADFGAAHLGDLSITATAGFIGTLAYMSPEQREGKPATVSSDIYGVGAVLFEMLTGERVPEGEGFSACPSGAHRDLDAHHDRVVLSLIAHDPANRPSDAFAARRALTALPWPTSVEPAAFPRGSRPMPSDRAPAPSRIQADADGNEIDGWVGRKIVRIPLSDTTLARASAFARAGHSALQTVLRVDRAAREIWLDAPRGIPLDRPLSPTEQAILRDALARLHEAGGIHGSIDRSHVITASDEAVTLCFARDASPTATIDRDHLALARLSD